MEHLAEQVARADPRTLLPSGRDVITATSGGLRCLDALPLGHDLWLAMTEDSAGARYPVPLVVTPDGVRRARPGDGAAEALVRALAGSTLATKGTGFTCTSWTAEPVSGEREISVDQTNESVVVGSAAVVKWSVTSPAGTHPAPERIAALAAADFDGMPAPWGLVQWRSAPGAEPELVATVVELLSGAQDGWEWAVEDLRAALEHGPSAHHVIAPARALGSLVARLHAALAAAGGRAATPEDAAQWAGAAEEELDAALALTDDDAGDRLRARERTIRTTLRSLRAAAGTPLIDIHGDLHVGQILRNGPVGSYRYAVTDFDGNPVLPPSQRAARQPAAADVAGMVQSLDHVGHVVVRRTPGVEPDVVAACSASAQQTFLEVYREELARLDASRLFDADLLDALRLRQVCREYIYAGRHLSRWLYVPDAALQALIPHED